MASYQYPRIKIGQGWTLDPENLKGRLWGRYEGIVGAKPPIFNYGSRQSPTSRFPGSSVHPWLVSSLEYPGPAPWRWRQRRHRWGEGGGRARVQNSRIATRTTLSQLGQFPEPPNRNQASEPASGKSNTQSVLSLNPASSTFLVKPDAVTVKRLRPQTTGPENPT